LLLAFCSIFDDKSTPIIPIKGSEEGSVSSPAVVRLQQSNSYNDIDDNKNGIIHMCI
jgi:hypothetical protein